VLFVLQLRLLTQRELTVPAFILRQVEHELAASGLRVEIGRSTFDPAGRLLLENVRLVAPSFNEPLFAARTIFLRFDPWALAVRQLDVSEVRAEGVFCFVPAMVSPTGRAEPLVRNAALTLYSKGNDNTFELPQLDAQVGPLAVSVTGAFAVKPRPVGEAPRTTEEWMRNYLRVARRAAELLPLLDEWRNPRLSLQLTPSEERFAFVRAELLADRFERTIAGAGPLVVDRVRATTGFALASAGTGRMQLDMSAAGLASDRLGRLADVALHAEGVLPSDRRPFALAELDVSAASLLRPDVSTGALRVQLAPADFPLLRGRAGVLLGGAPWSLTAEGDVRRRAGTLDAEGTLPPSLLEIVGRLAGRDLAALLSYDGTPTLRAGVVFAEGGRPASAHGRLDSGPVDVRGVPLDAAGSDFAWEGTRLVCDNLLLRQGESEARGRYEMDTVTNDYRFLLTGRLRPLGIEGWFHDWWTNFWDDFDFAAAPPEADVDVAGRWREPRLSRVFVGADALHPGLRGVPFDRVRTRVFVRPEFYDDLEFLATRGAHSARGRFTRTVDLEAGEWRSMDFAVRSDLELTEAGRLFGAAGTELLEPFAFEKPPTLELSGRLDGPASPDGEHIDVRIVGDSKGSFAFHRFPLEDLRFTAHVRDDDLLIEKLAVRYAGGEASGRVELRGRGDTRHLGFDAVLSNARLGEAIRSLETFSALRRGEPEPPQSKFQHRLARGRLDLALSAEGPYADPFAFKGAGNAEITGADLGEINLLGILSSLLRRTLLDFTTLQLDTARANFAVDGAKLAFSEFKLTGPRAAIEAHGDYYLKSKTMAFNAKVFPFEESSGLLGSAVGVVLTPLSNALEVKLSGQLESPSWTFVYGPTNFLRTLIGPSAGKDAAPSVPAGGAVTPPPRPGPAEASAISPPNRH
ncbi:MAG TPA: AsmA-like C-terminal region-containing protein, partial [Opitutaceae bacterium]